VNKNNDEVFFCAVLKTQHVNLDVTLAVLTGKKLHFLLDLNLVM